VTRLKFSKGVKQTFLEDVILSLEKQTFIMISLISGASLKDLNIICSGHLTNLLCEVKKLCMTQDYIDNIRFNVEKSQGLEGTHFNGGQLKYDYKGGPITIRVCLGKYGKLKSLGNLNRKAVLLSSAKRNFSTEKFDNFKNFKMYKGKYVNLIEVIADISFLKSVYQKIKSNLGIVIKKSNEKIFDDLDSHWFKKTSERLLNGSFHFMSAKKLKIFRPNNLDLKLLIIDNLKDKIVQQVIKIVLEHIYESVFLNISHGFRPFRGCHSALESIRLNWTGISWFLEFDIEKCYDTIDCYRLVSILKEKIDDQRFIDLIFKLFNEGVIGWQKKLGPDSSESIIQRSVVSPILVNIYLHKLDMEVGNIIKKYQKGKIRRKNLKAVNVDCRFSRNKKFKLFLSEKQITTMLKHKSVRCKPSVTMTD